MALLIWIDIAGKTSLFAWLLCCQKSSPNSGLIVGQTRDEPEWVLLQLGTLCGAESDPSMPRCCCCHDDGGYVAPAHTHCLFVDRQVSRQQDDTVKITHNTLALGLPCMEKWKGQKQYRGKLPEKKEKKQALHPPCQCMCVCVFYFFPGRFNSL